MSTELAKAFGWQPENLRATVVEDRGRRFPIIRAFSSGQPAAIFIASTGQAIQQELATACEYGYHSAVRWGLFADRRGILAFIPGLQMQALAPFARNHGLPDRHARPLAGIHVFFKRPGSKTWMAAT